MNSRYVPPNEQTVPFPDRASEAITEEQLAEIDRAELKRLETEAMDKHFRDHPHG